MVLLRVVERKMSIHGAHHAVAGAATAARAGTASRVIRVLVKFFLVKVEMPLDDAALRATVVSIKGLLVFTVPEVTARRQ